MGRDAFYANHRGAPMPNLAAGGKKAARLAGRLSARGMTLYSAAF
jgi:hypothetical protein